MRYRIEEARALLSRTPATLEALLSGLPSGFLDGNEGAGSWSPRQVLGHLVDAEEKLWIPRARSILEAGETRTFPAFDRFAHEELFRGWELSALLKRFEELRGASLSELSQLALPDAELAARTGRHPEFGSVTLRQLLSTWVVHDLAHLRQIARCMAKQYKEEVGPWARYIRALSE